MEAARENVSLHLAVERPPTRRGPFLPERRSPELVHPENPCGHEACSLFVLDKGKPVVRPGRKAKGRWDQTRRQPGCRKDETVRLEVAQRRVLTEPWGSGGYTAGRLRLQRPA